MSNYLRATTTTGMQTINSSEVPEGADILHPQDFIDGLLTLKDGEEIFTCVYPDELDWFDWCRSQVYGSVMTLIKKA